LTVGLATKIAKNPATAILEHRPSHSISGTQT